jgi:ABC-2 type transport system ATP-binding protein
MMQTVGAEQVPALRLTGLRKAYPKSVVAVDGVSLEVAQGEIFGLLGPNGAGKSTIIKTVLTLTRADEGEIRLLGVDPRKDQARARSLMGYVPQEVSVDGDLTGYENLLIFAKLYGVEGSVRGDRIRSALETMGLTDRADDLVKTYSGGMMRRLEIAQALVNRPRVLFLDEPSIGLDPVARHEVWRHVKELRRELEATIFITTHDMIEAERLCDRVAIINQGKVVAIGTPDALKAEVGGEVVVVRLARKGRESVEHVAFPPEIGATVIRDLPGGQAEGAGDEVAIVVRGRAEEAAPKVAAAFERAGLQLDALSFSKPTLDDVFLKYTMMRIVEAESFKQSRSARRNFRRHAR